MGLVEATYEENLRPPPKRKNEKKKTQQNGVVGEVIVEAVSGRHSVGY